MRALTDPCITEFCLKETKKNSWYKRVQKHRNASNSAVSTCSGTTVLSVKFNSVCRRQKTILVSPTTRVELRVGGNGPVFSLAPIFEEGQIFTGPELTGTYFYIVRVWNDINLVKLWSKLKYRNHR